MLNVSRSGSGNDRPFNRTKLGRRARRNRVYGLESLESRTLLSFTFNYTSVNGPQTVNESGGDDSFTVINDGFGHLEWSPDPTTTPFSTQWGPVAGDLLNASPAVTMTINLGSDNSAVIDGVSTVGSPATASASAVHAHFVLNGAPGNTRYSLVIDDTTSNSGRRNLHAQWKRASIRSSPGLSTTSTSAGVNLGMSGGATIDGQQRRQHFQRNVDVRG